MSDDLLNKIYIKIEQISADVTEVKVSSAAQVEIAKKHEETLQDHTKRSDNLEALYHSIKKDELEPLKEEIYILKGMYKLITLISLLALIGSFIYKMLGK